MHACSAYFFFKKNGCVFRNTGNLFSTCVLFPSNFSYLDANRIKRVPDNSFKTLKHLKQLRLDVNQLTEIPVVALNQAKMLEAM